MKKLIALSLLLFTAEAFPVVDLYDLIQDTYGSTWEEKPGNITSTVWNNLMENPNFIQALNTTNTNTPAYNKLQEQLRQTVLFIESAFAPIESKSVSSKNEVISLNDLIKEIYQEKWNEKSEKIKKGIFEILEKDEDFQKRLATNPKPNSNDYQKLISRITTLSEDLEFFFASENLRKIIKQESQKKYNSYPEGLKAVNTFRYQKNFAQELLKSCNEAEGEPEIQEILVDSWIESEYKTILKRSAQIQGIINEGDTCYQNSIYQVLKHAGIYQPMQNKLTEGLEIKEKDDIISFFKNKFLPEELTIKLSRDYKKFKEQLNKTLPEGEQQDAEYFFDLLSNKNPLGGEQNPLAKKLFNAFKIKKTYSNQCSNPTCGEKKQQNESVNKIDLSLVSTSTDLSQMIKDSLQAETIRCPLCKEKTYQQMSKLTLKGEYLLIQMPIHYKTIIPIVDGVKIPELAANVVENTQFSIPEYLNLTPKNGVENETTLLLIGVIAHYGETLSKGHYISLVNKQGRWFKCDDQTIDPIEPFNAQNKLKTIKDAHGTAKPYLLIYQNI